MVLVPGLDPVVAVAALAAGHVTSGVGISFLVLVVAVALGRDRGGAALVALDIGLTMRVRLGPAVALGVRTRHRGVVAARLRACLAARLPGGRSLRAVA